MGPIHTETNAFRKIVTYIKSTNSYAYVIRFINTLQSPFDIFIGKKENTTVKLGFYCDYAIKTTVLGFLTKTLTLVATVWDKHVVEYIFKDAIEYIVSGAKTTTTKSSNNPTKLFSVFWQFLFLVLLVLVIQYG